MKPLTIKFVVVLISFFVGVTAASIWVSNPPRRFANDIYFSAGTFALSESKSDLKVKYYSDCLAVMGEPALSTLHKRGVEVYRFVLSPPFDPPISIRLWKDGNQHYMTVKQLTAPADIIKELGYLKPLKIDNTRPLTVEEWQTFQDLLNKADFWSMPAEDGREGWDEASFLLEARKPSQYHVVERWSPRDVNFFNACTYLLKISELEIKH